MLGDLSKVYHQHKMTNTYEYLIKEDRLLVDSKELHTVGKRILSIFAVDKGSIKIFTTPLKKRHRYKVVDAMGRQASKSHKKQGLLHVGGAISVACRLYSSVDNEIIHIKNRIRWKAKDQKWFSIQGPASVFWGVGSN